MRTKIFINLFIAIACFFPIFLFGKTQKISSQTKDLISKAVYELRDPNYNGPMINYKKVDMFADRNDIKEGLKEELKNVSFYSLSLENISLKPNQRFNFYTQNALGDIMKVGDVYVKNDSKAYIKMLDKKAKEVLFENNIWSFYGVTPGEAIDYVLLSMDGKIHAAAHIISRPLESHGISGQTINLEVKSLDGELFLLSGENFKPNEELSFTSISEGEQFTHPFKVNKDGTFIMTLMPKVIGKKEWERDC